MEPFKLDKIDNLLLNLAGGLLPKDLTEDEVDLLKERYDENWFNQLGYTEKNTQRSKYDNLSTKEETDV